MVLTGETPLEKPGNASAKAKTASKKGPHLLGGGELLQRGLALLEPLRNGICGLHQCADSTVFLKRISTPPLQERSADRSSLKLQLATKFWAGPSWRGPTGVAQVPTQRTLRLHAWPIQIPWPALM